MKKRVLSFLFIITLFSLTAVSASAVVNDTLKVGIRWGDTALEAANLENAVGSGYEFGYYDEDREFVYLDETDETTITMQASGSGNGVTVTETLPELLRALYAGSGQHPELVFKPVWGAGCGGVGFRAAALQKELEGEASLLVVAHGVTGREAAPEPAQFLQQLKFRLPEGTDMALAYFGAFPSVEKVLPGLKGQKVVVLPFLIGKGKHMREDMPSSELAARHGKTLKILPPFGAFYLQAEREYWKTGMGESAGNGFDGPAR